MKGKGQESIRRWGFWGIYTPGDSLFATKLSGFERCTAHVAFFGGRARNMSYPVKTGNFIGSTLRHVKTTCFLAHLRLTVLPWICAVLPIFFFRSPMMIWNKPNITIGITQVHASGRQPRSPVLFITCVQCFLFFVHLNLCQCMQRSMGDCCLILLKAERLRGFLRMLQCL